MLYKGKGPAITDPLSGPLYITSSLGNKYTQSSMKMKLDDDEIKKLLATQTVTLVDSGIARWPGETMVIERQEIWHQERVSLLMVHAYYDTKGEDFGRRGVFIIEIEEAHQFTIVDRFSQMTSVFYYLLNKYNIDKMPEGWK
jgi:hypothetical protein